ncbi:MAG: hypothetical protein ACLFN8_03845 [Candidatus Woesearchaeota archaeon]
MVYAQQTQMTNVPETEDEPDNTLVNNLPEDLNCTINHVSENTQTTQYRGCGNIQCNTFGGRIGNFCSCDNKVEHSFCVIEEKNCPDLTISKSIDDNIVQETTNYFLFFSKNQDNTKLNIKFLDETENKFKDLKTITYTDLPFVEKILKDKLKNSLLLHDETNGENKLILLVFEETKYHYVIYNITNNSKSPSITEISHGEGLLEQTKTYKIDSLIQDSNINEVTKLSQEKGQNFYAIIKKDKNLPPTNIVEFSVSHDLNVIINRKSEDLFMFYSLTKYLHEYKTNILLATQSFKAHNSTNTFLNEVTDITKDIQADVITKIIISENDFKNAVKDMKDTIDCEIITSETNNQEDYTLCNYDDSNLKIIIVQEAGAEDVFFSPAIEQPIIIVNDNLIVTTKINDQNYENYDFYQLHDFQKTNPADELKQNTKKIITDLITKNTTKIIETKQNTLKISSTQEEIIITKIKNQEINVIETEKKLHSEVFLTTSKIVDDDAQTGNRLPAFENSDRFYLLIWLDDHSKVDGDIKNYQEKSTCSNVLGSNQEIEQIQTYIKLKTTDENEPYYDRVPLKITPRAGNACEFVIEHPHHAYGGIQGGAWADRNDQVYILETEIILSTYDNESKQKEYYELTSQDELRFYGMYASDGWVTYKQFDQEKSREAKQNLDKIKQTKNKQENEELLKIYSDNEYYNTINSYAYAVYDEKQIEAQTIQSCFFKEQDELDNCRKKGGEWYSFTIKQPQLKGLTIIELEEDKWTKKYESLGYVCAKEINDGCGDLNQEPCTYGCKNDLSSCMNTPTQGTCKEQCKILKSPLIDILSQESEIQGLDADIATIQRVEEPLVIDSIILNDDSPIQTIILDENSQYKQATLKVKVNNLGYEPLSIRAEIKHLTEDYSHTLVESVLPYSKEDESEIGFGEYETLTFDIDIPIFMLGEYKIYVTANQDDRTTTRGWYGDSRNSGVVRILTEDQIREESAVEFDLDRVLESANRKIMNEELTLFQEEKLENSVANFLNAYYKFVHANDFNSFYSSITDLFEVLAEIGEGEVAAKHIVLSLNDLNQHQKQAIATDVHQFISDIILVNNMAIYSDTLGAIDLASNTIYGKTDDPDTFWSGVREYFSLTIKRPLSFGMNAPIQQSLEVVSELAVKQGSYLYETSRKPLIHTRLNELATSSNLNKEASNTILKTKLEDYTQIHELLNNAYFTPAVLHDSFTYLSAIDSLFLCRMQLVSKDHYDACEAIYAEKINKFYIYDDNFKGGYSNLDAFFNHASNSLRTQLDFLGTQQRRLNIRGYFDLTGQIVVGVALSYYAIPYLLSGLAAKIASSSFAIFARSTMVKPILATLGISALIGFGGLELYQHRLCFAETRYSKEDLYREYDEYDLRTNTDTLDRCVESLIFSVAMYAGGFTGFYKGAADKTARFTSKNFGKKFAEYFRKSEKASSRIASATKSTTRGTAGARIRMTAPNSKKQPFMSNYWKSYDQRSSHVFDNVFGQAMQGGQHWGWRGTFTKKVDDMYVMASSGLSKVDASMRGAKEITPAMSKKLRQRFLPQLEQQYKSARAFAVQTKQQILIDYVDQEYKYILNIVEDVLPVNNARAASATATGQATKQKATAAKENINNRRSTINPEPKKTTTKPNPAASTKKQPTETVDIGRGKVSQRIVSGHGGVVQDAVYVNPTAKSFVVADGVSGAGSKAADSARILVRGDNNIEGLADKMASLYSQHKGKPDAYSKIHEELNIHLKQLDDYIKRTTEGATSTFNVGIITDDKRLLMFTLGDAEARIVRNNKLFHVEQFKWGGQAGEGTLFDGARILSETNPSTVIYTGGSKTQAVMPNLPYQIGDGAVSSGSFQPHFGVYQLKPKDKIMFSSDGLSKVSHNNPIRRERDFETILRNAANPLEAEQNIFKYVDEAMFIHGHRQDDIGIISIFVD